MTVLLAIGLLLSVSVSDGGAEPPSDATASSDALVSSDEPYGVFDRLAQCEASGNWQAVSAGGRYRGGIQADQTFWTRHGGLEYAPRADLASRSQQIRVARRGLAVQGWSAWPVCSRVIGAR